MIEVIQTVTVQPDGTISLALSSFPVGTTVNVTVRVEAETKLSNFLPRSPVSFIGAAKGTFATPTDVDRFIQQERSTWEL